jgi:Kef-type K+ transport system membrane component KefB
MSCLYYIQNKVVRYAFTVSMLICLCALPALAAGKVPNSEAEFGKVLLALIIILIAAKLGGDVFVRLGQPAVLGELVFGIIIGNVYLLRFHGFDFIKHDESVRILSEIGVTLLLFQVGLESDLKKMMKVGTSSLAVATIGVIAPFVLGWLVTALFLPESSGYVRAFVGATLCATSVGITARVLLDLGWIQSTEARIILGAAVIDDVEGLIILAIVSGIIAAASGGTTLSAAAIALIVIKAIVFLASALIIGRWISPWIFQVVSRLKVADLLLTTALGLCFGFAYLATIIGLAPIVGAFAAGIMLEEIHWRRFTERGEHSILELVKPLVGFLAPVFFVLMGASVDLATFANVSVLGFAAALTAAAIAGKQACGLGVLQKGLNRLSVGIGMIPRGEVGLIFAAIGSQLKIDGHPVIEPGTFSAVVIMVVFTTMITPPALKWSVVRSLRSGSGQSHRVEQSNEPAYPTDREG